MNKFLFFISGLVFVLLQAGCNSQKANTVQPIAITQRQSGISLTYGMVKKYLKIGKTTQTDVLKLFGSPNNMTISSNDHEVWIYDRIRTEISSNSQHSTTSGGIGGIGVGSSGGIAGGIGGSKSNSSSNLISTTNTLTVIMEFDKNSVLANYSVRQGRY